MRPLTYPLSLVRVEKSEILLTWWTSDQVDLICCIICFGTGSWDKILGKHLDGNITTAFICQAGGATPNCSKTEAYIVQHQRTTERDFAVSAETETQLQKYDRNRTETEIRRK